MRFKSLVLMSTLLLVVACAEDEKKACSQSQITSYELVGLLCNDVSEMSIDEIETASVESLVDSSLELAESLEACSLAIDNYESASWSSSCRYKNTESGAVSTVSLNAASVSSKKLKEKAYALKGRVEEMLTIKEMDKKNKKELGSASFLIEAIVDGASNDSALAVD